MLKYAKCRWPPIVYPEKPLLSGYSAFDAVPPKAFLRAPNPTYDRHPKWGPRRQAVRALP